MITAIPGYPRLGGDREIQEAQESKLLGLVLSI